jgi:hypothetical protein
MMRVVVQRLLPQTNRPFMTQEKHFGVTIAIHQKSRMRLFHSHVQVSNEVASRVVVTLKHQIEFGFFSWVQLFFFSRLFRQSVRLKH